MLSSLLLCRDPTFSPFPGELLIDQNSFLSYKLFHEDFLGSAGLKCSLPWAPRVLSILVVNNNKLKFLSTYYLPGIILSTFIHLFSYYLPGWRYCCYAHFASEKTDKVTILHGPLQWPEANTRLKLCNVKVSGPVASIHCEKYIPRPYLYLLDTPPGEPAVFYPFKVKGQVFRHLLKSFVNIFDSEQWSLLFTFFCANSKAQN